MNVKIISDSTCDLPHSLLEKYDIEISPLTVTLGDRSGYDGVNITPEDIYSYVNKTEKLPTTSSVSITEYEEKFRNWHNKGYEVVNICVSSKISGSYQNSCIAAKEISGVYTIDSENLSVGQGLLVLQAAELAQQGLSAQEITYRCAEMTPRIESSFILESIDYLRKGGRCSSLAVFGENLLHIKPCIEVSNGKMKPGKKYRGKMDHVIHSYAEDLLKNRQNEIEMKRIFLVHTAVDHQIVEDVRSMINYYCPETPEIIEATAGATITSHCGPGTLGIMFVRNS